MRDRTCESVRPCLHPTRPMMHETMLIKSRTQLDVLLVNMEASVKVRKRSDFFSWVQGVFQGLLPHEALVCALIDHAAGSYRSEWMSSHPLDEQRLADLCGGSGALVHRLIALWEHGGRQPIAIAAGATTDDPDQSLASEIQRLGLDNVLAHGIPGIDGRAAGFFCFSKLRGGVNRDRAITLELIVPYLYAAWARASCEPSKQSGSTLLPAKEVLTTRQAEILNWVGQGKSNGEIAQILDISQLTVKNHVQRILRKLNVQNRTQAVARGMALNLSLNGQRSSRS